VNQATLNQEMIDRAVRQCLQRREDVIQAHVDRLAADGDLCSLIALLEASRDGCEREAVVRLLDDIVTYERPSEGELRTVRGGLVHALIEQGSYTHGALPLLNKITARLDEMEAVRICDNCGGDLTAGSHNVRFDVDDFRCNPDPDWNSADWFGRE
jgi:hypothetical protein